MICIPYPPFDAKVKTGSHSDYFPLTALAVLVSCVFHTIERIGEASENPFEGGPNDISITALARTIEIDLRELLDETDIPPKIELKNNILS